MSKKPGVMQEGLMTWNLFIFTKMSLVQWLTKMVRTEIINYELRTKLGLLERAMQYRKS